MVSELQSYASRRMFLEYAARTMLGVTILPDAILSAADDKNAKKDEGKKKDAGKSDKSASANAKGGTAKHVIFLYMNGAMNAP